MSGFFSSRRPPHLSPGSWVRGCSQGRWKVGTKLEWILTTGLFPNQDTMPHRGFGNLIALPLQRGPRNEGNSVFLGDDFCPIPDQWSFLSLAKSLSIEKMHEVVHESERTGKLIGVRLSACDEEESDPWLMPPSQKNKSEVIAGPLPDRVAVTLGNLAYVPKDGLPSALLNQLLRLAAFQNPEFYRAQAMRLPTFGKPRVIHCAEEFSRHLGLPRGYQSEVIGLLESHGIQVELVDERFPGAPLDIRFHGELRPDQEKAAAELPAP